MQFILNIDTAVLGASVCLSQNGKPMLLKKNPEPVESAAWVHTAIQQLLQEQGIAMTQLAAVAVSAGPGSYTGLRVGMAAAKGLCYALQRPLLAVNTLEMMAMAALTEPSQLLCPMIDARRMEVFTALYTKDLEALIPPQALILQPDSFIDMLERQPITFFGNGSPKFQTLLQHPNAIFKAIQADAAHLSVRAWQLFGQQRFTDLAYSEPFYGKEFFSPPPKH